MSRGLSYALVHYGFIRIAMRSAKRALARSAAVPPSREDTA
ncbi:MAG TPA: hypothetical protein VF665_17800 [Longimicrobium sp.]